MPKDFIVSLKSINSPFWKMENTFDHYVTILSGIPAYPSSKKIKKKDRSWDRKKKQKKKHDRSSVPLAPTTILVCALFLTSVRFTVTVFCWFYRQLLIVSSFLETLMPPKGAWMPWCKLLCARSVKKRNILLEVRKRHEKNDPRNGGRLWGGKRKKLHAAVDFTTNVAWFYVF